ncbi:MAG: hypothetical protein DLM67_18715 [Candidatus Nephthysia bennettiae]|uniref:5-bromo-4-chloroindolyl phosphate hydrolysis protein n=1 Tax=Candidatus Nephthysia bennettiae TaxID=3127016 RepID=A0A934K402_9BACT|nr:hypothetical protein [Candidatus Dormibacteraeota bacterium]MBJ7611652.1 hypothetical protein [Candidatus Dormibacteraeota bacterium]PZR89712.1 MAG: hypothetical protein DLM67_18715 [Candidatus Dormibacteraeota bacterium]
MATSSPDPSPRSPRERLFSYLGSGKNIAGSGLALAALGLHFAGFAGPFWPAVVVAMYAIGVLVVPRHRPPGLGATLDVGEIRKALDRTVRMGEGRLPSDVQAKVAEIRQEVLDILPSANQFSAGSEDLYVIQRTATDYLPATLEAYLALPYAYATTRVLEGGKTPLDLLRAQLQLLDEKLDEITDAVHRQDSDRLLANGRFLEERFGKASGGLDLPPPQ